MRTLITPGEAIGIVGGGHAAEQLARAARTLGFRTHGFDPRRHASLSDALRAARELADRCAVVTAAGEDVRAELLDAIAERTQLRPGAPVLVLAQHRAREREWLGRAGFNVLPWRAAESRDTLVDAVRELGGPCWVKPQLRRRDDLRPLLVTGPSEAASAWLAMRGTPVVIEAHGHVDMELSVLVARGPAGAVETYPPARALREHGRLVGTTFPGRCPEQLAARAQALAGYLARKLGVEGLLTVEFFLLHDGRLVVNELVPAPHPTYDATDVACDTSQFEQLIRAVTGLPLGAPTVVSPAATVAIEPAPASRVAHALRVPGVRAHVYGRHAPARSGAHGHLTAVGATIDEAVTRLRLAEGGREPRRARTVALQLDHLHPSPHRRRRPRGSAP